MDAARRAVEAGVAEREDAAVARDEPVAETRRCRGHADDRLIEPHSTHRSVERASPYAKTPPSAAAIQPPRAVGVRATATASAVYEWIERDTTARRCGRVRRRSTPNVGAHGDGPGGTHGRPAAAGGAGSVHRDEARPGQRPSILASAGSKLLTLYDPSIPPSARRVPVEHHRVVRVRLLVRVARHASTTAAWAPCTPCRDPARGPPGSATTTPRRAGR